MNRLCELCMRETQPHDIVSIPLKREGLNESRVCKPCARKTDKFCPRHDVPHVGYIQNMSACEYCVNELTESNMSRAKTLSALLSVTASVDYEDFAKNKLDWVKDEIERDIGLIRYLVWEALCRKTTLDDIIRLIVTSESFDPIKVRDRALP